LRTLKSLDFTYQSFDQECLKGIGSNISKLRNLQSIKFDLGDNSELEDTTLLHIMEDFTNFQELRTLDMNLRDCFSINDTCTFKRMSAKFFFFPHLRDLKLNLNQNFFVQDDTLKYILRQLENLKKLKNLSLFLTEAEFVKEKSFWNLMNFVFDAERALENVTLDLSNLAWMMSQAPKKYIEKNDGKLQSLKNFKISLNLDNQIRKDEIYYLS